MDDMLTRLAGAITGRRKNGLAVRDDAPVPYVSSRMLSGGSGDGLPTADRAYEAYGSVGTLFAIVNQISNAVASVPWHLYRRTSVRDKSRRAEVLNHNFMAVWDRPNPFYTGRRLRETVQQHLDLVGEGVIVVYRVGSIVVEMWPVRPDRIVPVKHPTKFLTGYLYIGPDGEKVPLNLEDVIHIKYPNPADPYRGMGPVQSVLNTIDAAKYGSEWNKNFFINGARPGGVIKVDYRMSDTEWNSFVNRWRQQHQGVANAHRVAVLENAEWIDTNFSMTDMQFVELQEASREQIREAFAFPKPMLGTVEDVNRANAEAGKEIMAEGQTKPRLNRWKDEINTFLLPQFANGKALELDYEDPVPVNQEIKNATMLAQAAAYEKYIKSGVDPIDAALVCGLPEMNWIGIPTPALPGGSEEQGQEQESIEALMQYYMDNIMTVKRKEVTAK